MSNDSNTVTLQEPSQVKTTAAGAPQAGHVPPIFVVGVWRSGTTLLYALLNQHPDIRLFYESDLPVLWPIFRLPSGRKTWVQKWEYWNAGVSRHDLDPANLGTKINTLGEAVELAGKAYTGAKGGKIWGCKSPSYYDRLVGLSSEFPDARFIIIWRDPEEICRSVLKAASSALYFARPGMTHKALLASKTLKKQVEAIIEMGASVHQIHYRDLVENPTGTMRSICEFLQVPYNPAVTVLKKADRSAVFEGAHHSLARSGEIVARREREETLAPALKEKINRYKALWKAEHGDSWILSRHFTGVSGRKPGMLERVTDQVGYFALRLWDYSPRIAFSILPISAWKFYRRIKYKDAQFVHRHITNKPTTLRS
jgi:hypothetical protein